MPKITIPTLTPDMLEAGRPLDAPTLRQQIGMMNMFAISGGRTVRYSGSTVSLPAGGGYHVFITLAADDTYTVRRCFKRSGRFLIKGEVSGVFCDQIAEVAYIASCYSSHEFGE